MLQAGPSVPRLRARRSAEIGHSARGLLSAGRQKYRRPELARSRRVEGVDALAGGRVKTEVEARSIIGGNWVFRRKDPKPSGIAAVAERGCVLAEAGVAERLQRGVVEAFRPRKVADADRDVVDHRALS